MARPPDYYDKFQILPIGFFVNGAVYTVVYTVDNGKGRVRNNLYYSENTSSFVSSHNVEGNKIEHISLFMMDGEPPLLGNSKFHNCRCEILSAEMRDTLENKVLKLKRGGGTKWPR